MLDRLLDALASLPLVPTYLVLMVLSALENVFPPVPADIAVALGAFLARRGEVSVVPLAVLCWLANVGSAAGDLLPRAHATAARFFRDGWGRKVMPPAVARSRSRTRTIAGGWPGIFVSRFLPGLRAAVHAVRRRRRACRRCAPSCPRPPRRAIWYAFLAVAGYTLAAELGRR